MKKVSRQQGRAAWVALEEMETRTMLSAVPYAFHSLKGASNAAVLRARVAGLFSGATGETYSYALPSQSLEVLNGPEQLATFFSTAAPANMTATIDWGDGSVTTGTISKVPGHAGAAKEFAITGQHAFTTAGTRQIVIHLTIRSSLGTVNQTLNAEASVTGPASASPPEGTQPGAGPYLVGLTFDKIVGLAAAPPLNLLVSSVGETNVALTDIMIDWGDGTAPTPGVLESSGGLLGSTGLPGGPQVYTIAGSHAYATPGTYSVTITGVSPTAFTTGAAAGATVVAHAWAVVTQNSADGSNVVGAPGVPLSFAGGSINLGTKSPQDFTAMIDWGDGSATPGTLVVNGTGANGQATYAVVGSHAYAGEGNYRITATVYRGSTEALADVAAISYSTALISTPTVRGEQVLQVTTSGNDVQLNATLDEMELPPIRLQAEPGGGVLQLIPINGPTTQYVATIDWGDGTTTNASVTQPLYWTYPPGGITSFDYLFRIVSPTVGIGGSHTYASPGTYDVTVTVSAIYAPSNASPSAASETLAGTVVVAGDAGN